MRYQMLEHAADQAIRAYGHDLRELIENAAAGMLAVLYSSLPPVPQKEVWRTVEADSEELLLHHCLRELLYLWEDEELAPVSVSVERLDNLQAVMRIGVVPRAEMKPYVRAPIKAVTRHSLQIEQEKDLLTINVVFDV